MITGMMDSAVTMAAVITGIIIEMKGSAAMGREAMTITGIIIEMMDSAVTGRGAMTITGVTDNAAMDREVMTITEMKGSAVMDREVMIITGMTDSVRAEDQDRALAVDVTMIAAEFFSCPVFPIASLRIFLIQSGHSSLRMQNRICGFLKRQILSPLKKLRTASSQSAPRRHLPCPATFPLPSGHAL